MGEQLHPETVLKPEDADWESNAIGRRDEYRVLGFEAFVRLVALMQK